MIGDETFDISVENSLWVMASVRDRAIVGKHDSVGRGYLFLDPRRFGDYLTHDLWLDLDTTGRILIRASMEGEKDDSQFYFGRAFRSLKRAEGDMIRVIIDKVRAHPCVASFVLIDLMRSQMAPLIRQYVNRNVLAALIKSTIQGYDYNKALAGVTGFYRSAIGADKADSVIPLPAKDKPRIKPEGLSDEEIEGAITPLFDYFDANLQIFNSFLATTTKETVMLKLWKEILATIECLLVPPLSDAPSDMKPLADKEVDIVFKWLKVSAIIVQVHEGARLLMTLVVSEGLHLRRRRRPSAIGTAPESALSRYPQHKTVLRLDYVSHVSNLLTIDNSCCHRDDLMEECVRLMQQNLRADPTVKKRAKSVYSQRNLGTIKERKREKKQDAQQGNGDMILRILRMRKVYSVCLRGSY